MYFIGYIEKMDNFGGVESFELKTYSAEIFENLSMAEKKAVAIARDLGNEVCVCRVMAKFEPIPREVRKVLLEPEGGLRC